MAEEKGIVDTLKENGYPLTFIYRHSHCMYVVTYPDQWKMPGGIQGSF